MDNQKLVAVLEQAVAAAGDYLAAHCDDLADLPKNVKSLGDKGDYIDWQVLEWDGEIDLQLPNGRRLILRQMLSSPEGHSKLVYALV